MSGNPVNWFEIPVRDMARAAAFYEQVFGVTLVLNELGPLQMAWFPMAPGVTGAAGTLIQGDGYEPSSFGTLVYFEVADVDETLLRVESFGGRALMAKTSIGEHGFIAHFEDSEGNRVALHSRLGGSQELQHDHKSLQHEEREGHEGMKEDLKDS